MKAKLLEHLLSIVLVTAALGIGAGVLERHDASRETARGAAIEPYLKLNFLNLDDPSQRALLHETLDAFFPDRKDRNDSLIAAIEKYRQEQFSNPAQKTGSETGELTGEVFARLFPMYVEFIALYLIVMILTYRAAHSLAILRFIALKQNRPLRLVQPSRGVTWLGRSVIAIASGLASVVAYAILFSPAYVIGYSFRSTFDSSSMLVLAGLAIVSNGLLVNYANKFFTFLVAESRKGYVETAIVKNLSGSYEWKVPGGLTYKSVLRPNTIPATHSISQIYANARQQFIPSLKEHASYLITGLIIIEMALNIHGRLGYELLQTILYKHYVITMLIVLGMFLLVKATEIIVDVWHLVESRRYEA